MRRDARVVRARASEDVSWLLEAETSRGDIFLGAKTRKRRESLRKIREKRLEIQTFRLHFERERRRE